MEIITTPTFAYLSLAVIIIFLIMVIRLELKIKKLTKGGSVDDLESAIIKNFSEVSELNNEVNKINTTLKDMNKKSEGYIQNVGLVRFNPFSDAGSNQSFASAFLDKNNNGIVISTLYSRDRVGVYAKPINDGKSSYELTDEEKKAIIEANKN